jgi:hypothetical protein
MKLKIAYIAGSYTADTTYEVRNNIRRAEKVNEWAWQNGYAAICPHTNTQFLDGLCDYHIWASGYLYIVERCDLMILVPEWENSKGTKAEISLARKLIIPIYHWYQSYEKGVWLEEYKG